MASTIIFSITFLIIICLEFVYKVLFIKDKVLDAGDRSDLEIANRELVDVKNELVAARIEAEKLREVMKVKDDEVLFLCNYVSQLTQGISQPSSPPSSDS